MNYYNLSFNSYVISFCIKEYFFFVKLINFNIFLEILRFIKFNLIIFICRVIDLFDVFMNV